MKSFEIELAGDLLTVLPQDGDVFKIYNNETYIGTIQSGLNNMGVEWKVIDLITDEYAKQIGELIEEHEM
jgi:hypothetical protein